MEPFEPSHVLLLVLHSSKETLRLEQSSSDPAGIQKGELYMSEMRSHGQVLVTDYMSNPNPIEGLDAILASMDLHISVLAFLPHTG